MRNLDFSNCHDNLIFVPISMRNHFLSNRIWNAFGLFIRTTERSCRMFVCFYSPIFQLMSAKFQTFAYNSRTVRSSCMKFWQQFEINELYVSPNFKAIGHMTLIFRTRKPPQKFGVKSGLSQKRLKYGKIFFIWFYVLRYPFIPTNSLLAAMRFFFFFFLFFSSFS